MKKVWLFVIIIAVIIVAVLWFTVSVRNSLIAMDESVNANWSQIETQLQRRADLIPNLVSAVKGYAVHEEKIFTEVADARARLLGADGAQAKAEASDELSSALGRLMAIAESYPELKADISFVRLQDELAGTENRIAVARTRFNDAVRSYNAAIRQFPGSLFAGGMGLTMREYFESSTGRTALAQTPEFKF